MPERFDLDRFARAQEPVLAQAHKELQEGRKHSHWMWFVFPQLAGLGNSAMARHYAISSLAEAQAYLEHPVLGPRLARCTDLVNRVEGRSINQIFGSPDDLKFHSCMTLFHQAQLRIQPDEGSGRSVFHDALDKYFSGEPDRLTVEKYGSRNGN